MNRSFSRGEMIGFALGALCLAVVGCGHSGGNADSDITATLEKLPVGLKVIHTPEKVTKMDGPKDRDWPYMWHFRTEIQAIDRKLTITQFGILAWDGPKWILNAKQEKYNSGVSGKEVFMEWYGSKDAVIAPGKPAVDDSNWAGSRSPNSFKQKWFYIGVDDQGKSYKGEGVVELIGKD